MENVVMDNEVKEARLAALRECYEIADLHAHVFGDMSYERCAKDIRATILHLMQRVVRST